MIDADGYIIHNDFLDDITVKRLLLVFDKIHILSPHEQLWLVPKNYQKVDFGHMLMWMEDYVPLWEGDKRKESEERLIDSFDYAYKKGILRVEDPRSRGVYQSHWLGLRLAYEYDTANPQLIEATRPLLKNEKGNIRNGIIRGGFFEPKGANFYPKIPSVPPVFSDKEVHEYRYDLQSFSAIGRLDRDLLIADKIGAVPCFIDRTTAALYARKAYAATQNREVELNAEYRNRSGLSLQQLQYYLYQVSKPIVPDSVLAKIPVDELIITRERALDKLKKLRRRVKGDLSQLKSAHFDENYTEEVEKFIKCKIAPEMNTFQRKFISLLGEMLTVETIFLSAAIPASLSVMPHLSPGQIALWTGISATVGSQVHKLTNLLHNRRKQIENTYAYFFEFLE